MYNNSAVFRGFGVTQSIFAIESMMDILQNLALISGTRRKNALREAVNEYGTVLRRALACWIVSI
jgi:hypothetical protein